MAKTKNKVGRPKKLTTEQIEKIVEDFKKYIVDKVDPTIVGFTSSYEILKDNKGKDFYVNKDYISDHDEFSELRKKAIEKQEAYLASGATKNELNATMSVFRLKQPQHGYTDKQEIDQTNYNHEIPQINVNKNYDKKTDK